MTTYPNGSYDKGMASTGGYQTQEASIYPSFLVEDSFANEEYDLEQSCLLRLKSQREKIEHLTELYKENEALLINENEKAREMQKEIDRLTQLSQYKQLYFELKKEYDALLKKNNINEMDLQATKQEIAQIMDESAENIIKLKGQIKILKERSFTSSENWESVVYDKDEEIQKLLRSFQEKEFQYNEAIKNLKQEIEDLSEALKEKDQRIYNDQKFFEEELKIREYDLINVEKMLECSKKQSLEFKAKIMDLSDQLEKQQSQANLTIQQYKFQLKTSKKDIKDKQVLLYECKDQLKKSQSKNQILESNVGTLKQNLKKLKDCSQTAVKQISLQAQEDKAKLQLFINELKNSLEEQMQIKGILMNENKKLKTIIQRKEQQERQRKQMLITEFREIDKLEKVINRI